MKNKIIISLFSIFLSLSLFGQPGNGYYTKTVASDQISPADNAKDIIQQIIDVVGLKPNFEVRSARIDNAAAVIYSGKRFILYNPNFFASLIKSTGTKWAAVSVLAHEIGHHLNGHTLSQIGNELQSELEADEFSGFVLRKMGASLTDAQAAMKTAAAQRATSTHPGQYDRLVAIANGWNKADAQVTGKKFEPVNPQTTQPAIVSGNPSSAPINQTTIDNRYIIGDVRFNADPNSAYYVTTRYNLVKVNNNQLSVIGKLAQLNSSRYPYLIYDEDNTQLLVDAYGNIITKQGKQVGKLSARRG
jgi:hypothetical protein